MDPKGREFFEELIRCGSPTGSEQRVQRFLRDWAKPFAGRVDADLHGNLAIVVNPTAGERPGGRRVMLAGHCDQIGFMVMKIDDNGYIRVDALGGVDEQTILGEHVVIHARAGDVHGVVGKTATHNQKSSDREKTPRVEDVWIDVGARSKEEIEEIVSIGDYATFVPRILDLRNGRVAAPGVDNAAGLWAVMETARRCAEAARDLDVALYCVSTVQEEIGSRGADTAANRISPDVAIAVDTTLAVDDPGQPLKRTTPAVKLDAGPSISCGPNTNPMVAKLLTDAAARLGLGHQREPNASPEANDAKSLQVADGGAATASVGIPIRNMHTQVEVVSLDDLESTARFLTEFVRTLRADTDLLPINFKSGREEPAASSNGRRRTRSDARRAASR